MNEEKVLDPVALMQRTQQEVAEALKRHLEEASRVKDQLANLQRNVIALNAQNTMLTELLKELTMAKPSQEIKKETPNA